MKIHIFIFFTIITLTKQSIVLKEKKNKVIPESNKLQINFGKQDAPIEISTNQKITNIKSHSNILIDPLSKDSDYESPLHKQNVYGKSNNLFNAEIMNTNYESSNPSINEHHYTNKIKSLEDETKIEEKNDPIISKDCTSENCSTNRKINQAYSQLGNLRDELETALNEDEHEEPVLMSGNTLKTVIAYLKHLDYINKQEHGEKIGLVPEMPVHKEYEPDYEVDEKAVLEKFEKEKTDKIDYKAKIEERRKILEKAIEDYDKDLKDLNDEGGHDTDKLDLETEKQKVLEEIENIDNETFDIEKRLEVEKEIEKVKKIKEEEIEKQKVKDAMELDKEQKKLEGEEKNIDGEIKTGSEIIDLETRIDAINKDEEALKDDPEITNILEKEKEELEEKVDDLKTEDEAVVTETTETKTPEPTGLDDELTQEEKDEKNKKDFELDNLGKTEEKEKENTIKIDDFNNISDYLRILKDVLKGYNLMFEFIPDSTRGLPKNSETELAKGIKIYNNLRRFVVSININMEHLKNDVNYLDRKINSIELSHEEIIYFYVLGEKYDEINIVADRKNKNFIKKTGLLRQGTSKFITEVKKVMHNLTMLTEYNELLFKEVEFIKDDMESETESTYTADIKVKETLKIVPKLIDLKKKIQGNIKEIETCFNTIYTDRAEMSVIIDDMDLINQGKYFTKEDQEDPLSNGYSIKWSFVGIFFGILLL